MLNIEKIKKIKSDKIWFFRFKKFDENNYLITNDVWEYSFLSSDDFWNFIAWKITKWEKYDELLIKSFIKNNSYEQDLIDKYYTKNHFLSFWPSLHIIVTTLRCNHKCRYCHAAAAPKNAKNMDMTEETARKVVDTIFYTSSPNITIEFQWWESLLNWDIIKFIVEYAEIKSFHLQKNTTFSLVSNLTLMDEEKLDYLVKHNVHISTSLDWNEIVHNYNRTYEEWNSFEVVTKWIKRIQEKYRELEWNDPDYDGKSKRLVWALLTASKKSLPYYKEIIDTYISLWLTTIFLRPLNPYWFAAADIKSLWYTTDEYYEFYKNALDYIIEKNKEWVRFSEMTANIFLLKILTPKDPNYLDERSPCWACIWQVAYNYDGKIYSCDEWRMFGRMWDDNFLMTELLEDWEKTYNAMIESETTKIMVQASTLDWLPWYNDSVYKSYIWVCPISSYKSNNNIIPTYSTDTKKILDYKILDYIFWKLLQEENKKIFESWLDISNFLVSTKSE